MHALGNRVAILRRRFQLRARGAPDRLEKPVERHPRRQVVELMRARSKRLKRGFHIGITAFLACQSAPGRTGADTAR